MGRCEGTCCAQAAGGGCKQHHPSSAAKRTVTGDNPRARPARHKRSAALDKPKRRKEHSPVSSVLLSVGSHGSGGCGREFVLSGTCNRALPNCLDGSWTPGILN